MDPVSFVDTTHASTKRSWDLSSRILPIYGYGTWRAMKVALAPVDVRPARDWGVATSQDGAGQIIALRCNDGSSPPFYVPAASSVGVCPTTTSRHSSTRTVSSD